MNKSAYRLILGSSSPRRKELLQHLHLPFEIIPSTVDEVMDANLEPENLVLKLAQEKASDVFDKLREQNDRENLAVIGADTIVVLDRTFLGKPIDKQDAINMLKRLSGRTHEVYTGVALMLWQPDAGVREHTHVEVSSVKFRELSEQEIMAYVELKEPMDKAGAYALQGTGSAFVEGIEGCVTNIIGLPIPSVVSLLRQAGIAVLGHSQL